MDESELVLTELLGCSRTALMQKRHTLLGGTRGTRLAQVLKRRLQGEPIQYILGKVEFMDFSLEVTPDVLIPRPETEVLVETAVEYAQRNRNVPKALRILDIGTGSGCIAIALARMLDGASVDAVDISEAALVVARSNALHCNARVNFFHGNMLAFPISYQLTANTYDIIVSNPPYVATGDRVSLQREVQREPSIALDGGEDGLQYIRALADVGIRMLKHQGILCMEIGYNQEDAVATLLLNRGLYRILEIRRDYSSIPRIVVAEVNNHG